MMDDRPVLIIGGGGHAKVLIDTLLVLKAAVLGIVDADSQKIGQSILGVKILGDDSIIGNYSPQEILLVNGIGAIAPMPVRVKLYERFHSQGYTFAAVIHPSAIVAKNAQLGEGVQVMAGAIIQPGCELGFNTIVNTRASVDHDCKLAAHVHIAPGCVLSGNVSVGRYTHIGTGSTVIQGIHIGAASLVGAGAVVVQDVGDGQTVYGVPARGKC